MGYNGYNAITAFVDTWSSYRTSTAYDWYETGFDEKVQGGACDVVGARVGAAPRPHWITLFETCAGIIAFYRVATAYAWFMIGQALQGLHYSMMNSGSTTVYAGLILLTSTAHPSFQEFPLLQAGLAFI